MSNTTTISHEIAVTLRSEILRQQYRSGERLPSERDLASRFDANRGAVREALSQLEQTGLINIQPGGARVQAIESASIAILGPLMNLEEFPDPELVSQFLRTFGTLAAGSAREALERANADQLDRMQTMVVSLAKHSREIEAMQPLWVEFIEYMAEVADNLVVRLIGNDLKAQFAGQMVQLGFKPKLNKKVLDEVLYSLLQSLTSRDGERAGAAIQIYFDELRFSIVKDIDIRLGTLQKQAS
ncbi:MAG: GntR family transcriptional regulator [Gammaproteobacteria bacterium]|nr:GntR family transcriptional regulator [Gammaproteobacteria bacterium]